MAFILWDIIYLFFVYYLFFTFLLIYFLFNCFTIYFSWLFSFIFLFICYLFSFYLLFYCTYLVKSVNRHTHTHTLIFVCVCKLVLLIEGLVSLQMCSLRCKLVNNRYVCDWSSKFHSVVHEYTCTKISYYWKIIFAFI